MLLSYKGPHPPHLALVSSRLGRKTEAYDEKRWCWDEGYVPLCDRIRMEAWNMVPLLEWGVAGLNFVRGAVFEQENGKGEDCWN